VIYVCCARNILYCIVYLLYTVCYIMCSQCISFVMHAVYISTHYNSPAINVWFVCIILRKIAPEMENNSSIACGWDHSDHVSERSRCNRQVRLWLRTLADGGAES